MAHKLFWKEINLTWNDQTVYYHYSILKDNVEHDVHDILASNSNVTYVHNAEHTRHLDLLISNFDQYLLSGAELKTLNVFNSMTNNFDTQLLNPK